MASGWGFALQAGVNGYLRGQGLMKDMENAEEEKKFRDEQRAIAREDTAEKRH